MFRGTTETGDPIKYYVYARQFANFTASNTLISQGDTVQFTDTSDAGPVRWYWDFGDGENSTLQNPQHTYRKFGNFTVTLKAWNDLGSDTITREEYIRMYPTAAPVAKFTHNFTYAHYFPPLAVAFKDTSTGMNLSWYWDFGDGRNSTEQDPVHIYARIPDDKLYVDYTINLTVTDELGRKSLSSDYVYVQYNVTPDFIAEPRVSSENLTITFTDLTPRGNWTYGMYNSSYYQAWDFGDGEGAAWRPAAHEDYEQPPVSVTHEYRQPGNYTVSLSTDFFCGGESQITTSKTDYISIVGDATLLMTDFSANTTAGVKPLAVAFTDISTGSPVGWNWSFGDETGSQEQNPLHIYSTPGTYSVTLNTTNVLGSNVSTKHDYIIVTAPRLPTAAFSANITTGYSPLPVAFHDESWYLPAHWSWDFGDEQHSDEQNPLHLYPAPGYYTVNLTVANDQGSDSVIKTEYIHVLSEIPFIMDSTGGPVVNFTSNTTSGRAPLTVEFTDLSSGSPGSWQWTFGDGVTSSVQNPIHEYMSSGRYTVSLRATNAYGSDILIRHDYIVVKSGIMPVPEFPLTGHS